MAKAAPGFFSRMFWGAPDPKEEKLVELENKLEQQNESLKEVKQQMRKVVSTLNKVLKVQKLWMQDQKSEEGDENIEEDASEDLSEEEDVTCDLNLACDSTSDSGSVDRFEGSPPKPDWRWHITTLEQGLSLPEQGDACIVILNGPWTRAAVEFMSGKSKTAPGKVQTHCPDDNRNDVYVTTLECFITLSAKFDLLDHRLLLFERKNLPTSFPLQIQLFYTSDHNFINQCLSSINGGMYGLPLPTHSNVNVLLQSDVPAYVALESSHVSNGKRLLYLATDSGALLDISTPLNVFAIEKENGVEDGCKMYAQFSA